MKYRNRAARRRHHLRQDAARLVLDSRSDAGLSEANLTPELEAEVEAMRSVTGSLERLSASAWTGVPAPASATPRFDLSSRSRTHRGAWAAGALALCLSAAFIVGAVSHPFLSTSHRRLAPGSVRVTLHPLAGHPASAAAVAYMTPRNRMIVRIHGLSPSAPGTFYELWLMSSNTDLVPVTSFRIGASGAARLALLLPDSPSRYRYLDVSVQRLSSGNAISPDSVLRGRLNS